MPLEWNRINTFSADKFLIKTTQIKFKCLFQSFYSSFHGPYLFIVLTELMQKDICSVFTSLGLISAAFPMDAFSPIFVSLFFSYKYVGLFCLFFFFLNMPITSLFLFKKWIFLIIDWFNIHIISVL